MFPDLEYAPAIITMVFIVLDIVSGILKAICTKTLSSGKMRDGLFHKAGSIFLVFVSAVCSEAVVFWDALPDAFGYVYVGICLYICLMEVISILENVVVINPELSVNKIFSIFKLNKDDVEE